MSCGCNNNNQFQGLADAKELTANDVRETFVKHYNSLSSEKKNQILMSVITSQSLNSVWDEMAQVVPPLCKKGLGIEASNWFNRNRTPVFIAGGTLLAFGIAKMTNII